MKRTSFVFIFIAILSFIITIGMVACNSTDKPKDPWGDIIPPLLNTNDFSDFEPPEYGTNQPANTNIDIIVAP